MKKIYFIIGLLAITCIGTVNLRAQDKFSDKEENEGTSVRDRINWYYMQRAYPNGIPNGARLKALGIARAMTGALKRNNATLIQSATWQPVGPSNGGGRIEAIAVDPSGTLYIGAAEGGVWRGTTTNGTNWTWTPLTDKADALAMGALAIDPTNAQTIYAGTGEWNLSFGGPFTTQSPIYSGAGMLKSTDGGSTWSNVGLTNVAAFSRIIVNPDNHNIVWAAGFNGLYRSSDGGNTWSTLIPDSLCCDLALDPNDHTRLYVAIQNQGMFGIVDPSPALHPLNNGFPQPDSTVGRIAISAANNNGQTVIYAVVAEQSGAFKGIYKLSGGGWSLCAYPGSGLFAEKQGWYDITIAASPTDANTVIVGG
ncbi:MAG TPA: sialidase family protein, partial [Candidatus Kapabacteria bacterium]|nr:sialidase family protein [Candidatus Kapabacteria bacterium]